MPVLPDEQRVKHFVATESHDVEMLAEIPVSLKEIDVGVGHNRHGRRLNGLEFLYVRYTHSPVVSSGKTPTASEVSSYLNDAGYRIIGVGDAVSGRASKAQRLTSHHFGNLLYELRTVVRAELENADSDRKLVEEILSAEHVLVAPNRYEEPGGLFAAESLRVDDAAGPATGVHGRPDGEESLNLDPPRS